MPSMNSLFLGLVAAGIALVIGVLLYNWLQERRLRHRLEAAFTRSPSASADEDRIEPELLGDGEATAQSVAVQDGIEDDAAAATESEPLDAPVRHIVPSTRIERAGVAPDTDIECVVVLHPQRPARSPALGGTLGATFAKPVRWLGRRGAGQPWQAIAASVEGPWEDVAACMLLANRAGAASPSDIDPFLRQVADVAAALPASFTPPDSTAEASRAEELDRFCADLDVQIGLTILTAQIGQIAGTRLRGVAEAAGFRLNAAGHFDYLQEETGVPIYSLQNFKQEPFTVESLRKLTTPGVVLLLDVPRVADPVRVFDQMRLAAKRMTQTLEGVLVDDNRHPITDASLAAIRAQVQATATALREANIDPGGPRALRLFG